jgi:hypothetical protein
LGHFPDLGVVVVLPHLVYARLIRLRSTIFWGPAQKLVKAAMGMNIRALVVPAGAIKNFNDLNLSNITSKGQLKSVGIDSNGNSITLRPAKSGSPTIQGPDFTIRYP